MVIPRGVSPDTFNPCSLRPDHPLIPPPLNLITQIVAKEQGLNQVSGHSRISVLGLLHP